MMKISSTPLTSIRGFSATGRSIGIKNGKKDLGIAYSAAPCTCAGVFTTNRVKAAPLILSENHLRGGVAQALVVNSGIANACTGDEGMKNAEKTAELVAEELGIRREHVVVMSTGIIGKQLPMDRLENGIRGVKKELGESEAHGRDFAEAILTTDTAKKEVFVECDGFGIAGVAKGSGMIEPNMATMLGFIFTDAKLEPDYAKSALKSAVDKSFNCISVDACQSTNDSVILMANGLAGRVDGREFEKALEKACLELAKMIVMDGEGATKFVEVHVNGAGKKEDAKKVAKAVINNSLVKTAFFGCDPNIGRIMAALGTADASFDPEKIDVYVGSEQVIRKGMANGFDEESVKKIMGGREFTVRVDLNDGGESARVFGCDLSFDYVKINGHYRT